MKKSDIALIILIVSISLVVSYLIIKAVLGEPKSGDMTAEKVELISADVVKPQSSVFNENAINPTVVITIGEQANEQPFGVQ